MAASLHFCRTLLFKPYTSAQLLRNVSRCFHHPTLKSPTLPKLVSLQFPRVNRTTSAHIFLSKPSPWMQSVRTISQGAKKRQEANRTTVIYLTAFGVFMIGMSYLGVPLYRMFCQAVGMGGRAEVGHDTSKVESMQPVKERKIKVHFQADTHSSMQWNFRPVQREITVVPGETALAFFTAKNPTDKPIVGISTYNITPYQAGIYFNKIQCFCFEEQMLNPHEQVDMPVFFFIDPEFDDDPKLARVEDITLSYSFFEAKEGFTLPVPGFMQQKT